MQEGLDSCSVRTVSKFSGGLSNSPGAGMLAFQGASQETGLVQPREEVTLKRTQKQLPGKGKARCFPVVHDRRQK